jgi:hypothetical protein
MYTTILQSYTYKYILPQVYDVELTKYLMKHDLTNRIKSNASIDQTHVANLLKESERYGPSLAKIKDEVEKGVYVDEQKVYVRWVNDEVRYGLFAGKDFVPREFIGVYAGKLLKCFVY